MFRQVGVKSIGEAKKGGGRNAIHNIQKPREDTGSLHVCIFTEEHTSLRAPPRPLSGPGLRHLQMEIKSTTYARAENS